MRRGRPDPGQTQVQLYGRLNVSAEYVKASATADGPRLSQQRVSNNRSVLGFRGSEDLGGGVSAIFQVEGTLSLDTGAGELARRDTRVGLDGGFGTLFAGHWVTAYNGATSSLDPFYPTTAGYMSIIGNGAGAAVDNLAEERPASGARPSLTSAAMVYEQGPWYATLAHERHHEYQGPGLSDSGTKLAVTRRFGDTRVALLAERLEYETPAGGLDRNAWYVSVTHQLGAHGLRLALAHAGDGKGDGKGASGNRVGFIRGGARTGATHVTLGYEYLLSKRTALHAYVTHLDNEENGGYDFAINSLGAAPGATLKGATLGLRHSF